MYYRLDTILPTFLFASEKENLVLIFARWGLATDGFVGEISLFTLANNDQVYLLMGIYP